MAEPTWRLCDKRVLMLVWPPRLGDQPAGVSLISSRLYGCATLSNVTACQLSLRYICGVKKMYYLTHTGAPLTAAHICLAFLQLQLHQYHNTCSFGRLLIRAVHVLLTMCSITWVLVS